MARTKAKTGGTAASSRSKNFTPGEYIGVLTAAASHWASYRGSRTGDKKRRSGAAMLETFVNATPAKDRPLARTRTADSINKKIKNMRSRYMDTCQGLRSTGMSTAQREDLLITFGGAELYDLAREAFKTAHVSTQVTVHQPVDLLATAATVPREQGSTAVVPPRLSAENDGRAAGSGGAGGDSAEGCDGAGSDGDSVGIDGDVDAESSAESGPEKPPCGGGAERIASAADIAAAASPAKKAKRDTSVGLFRQYLSEKTRPAAIVEAGGTTESDVRQALVNMINAFADKARQG